MGVYKLIPALKDYIWGGTNLKKYRPSTLDVISESWELSLHDDGLTKVIHNEKEIPLKDLLTEEDIGINSSVFPFFPVLIKLIDAKENLSVQVHPSDEYALKNENSYGKIEMWYVLKADDKAGLYVGFKEDEKKEKVLEYLNNGTILNHLNFFKVKEGDCFFIPPGTIHAIGAGVTLIEVQQNSNLTYRLYDYNRIDKNGKARELHIEKALNVIDYNKYQKVKSKDDILGSCKYFTSLLKNAKTDNIIFDENSFVCINFISGSGYINDIPYSKFDSFFITANQKAYINGVGEYILTKVEKQ